jgi:hypothetical protein
MTLHPIPSEVPYMRGKFSFLFFIALVEVVIFSSIFFKTVRNSFQRLKYQGELEGIKKTFSGIASCCRVPSCAQNRFDELGHINAHA